MSVKIGSNYFNNCRTKTISTNAAAGAVDANGKINF